MDGLCDMAGDQQSLVELIRDFMTREVKPHVLEWEKGGHYPKEITQMEIDMGLYMMQVPEEYGGMGLDTTTTTMMTEGGAKVESTYMGMFNVTSMGGKVVMAAGNEEQKQHYAGPLNKGFISAFCLTEPGAGSDSAAVRTMAVRRGGSYVINGIKTFITNTSSADTFLVVASVDPSKGPRGLVTFIVERDRKGVNVSKEIDKFGMRLPNTAEVIFEDVEIPARNLVGMEESGLANVMKVLTTSRPITVASSLGACQLARDLAVQYSKGRVASGKPIYAKQTIQEKLVDMEMLIQASCGFAYHAIMLLDQGKPCNTEAPVAKCFVTEAFGRITDQVLQILGGYGLCDEYLISKLYQDTWVNRIVEGINEIQRVVISRVMLCQN